MPSFLTRKTATTDVSAELAPDTPDELLGELVSAQAYYQDVKSDVIDRATKRVVAVQTTIADLQAESDNLGDVIERAKVG